MQWLYHNYTKEHNISRLKQMKKGQYQQVYCERIYLMSKMCFVAYE